MIKLNDQALLEKIVRAAEEKKGLNIKALDVRKSSPVADFLVVVSGESAPQLKAIESEIDKTLRSTKIRGFRWQGDPSSGWLILDLGSIVVHIMGETERDYYGLEELWGHDAVVYHY